MGMFDDDILKREAKDKFNRMIAASINGFITTFKIPGYYVTYADGLFYLEQVETVRGVARYTTTLSASHPGEIWDAITKDLVIDSKLKGRLYDIRNRVVLNK